MECPQGYERINATFCHDINECRLQGMCPNGECLNTIGSYRCRCKSGFVPDHLLSSCVVDNNPIVSEEKGPCYRFFSPGKQCLHPIAVQLSQQICCCTVGKAWGPHCEKCPVPGTDAFKEICPGGMGYTVPSVPRNPIRVLPPARTNTVHPPIRTTNRQYITKEEAIEALSVPEKNNPRIPEQKEVYGDHGQV
ncbi:hypothetical protein GDO86_019501 [Hymenochirus boettgeri]|uniref:Uncharacterized protein n=1 Tax=Hymenochirus boettgeri TaxID=247094 RepID=A0A8T2IEU3_9PIPI|nr:hypothetical protein GDO86_019501 [Hymenochirus boettgeri]